MKGGFQVANLDKNEEDENSRVHYFTEGIQLSEEQQKKPLETKHIIKRALKHPELFTEGELSYFQLLKEHRKKQKKQDKENRSDYLK